MEPDSPKGRAVVIRGSAPGGRVRAGLRRLAGQRRRVDPTIYRHGIPNRAEEIVAGDAVAQALIAAGALTMGEYSYYAPTVRMYAGDTGKVRVGRFSSIASGVEVFVGGAHRTDWVSTYGIRIVFDLPGAFEDGTPMSRGDVVIGSDCWLARGSVVMSGVTIGDGAVVGAHSVVTRDVRPYAVVAGNPAREQRRRFSDEQVEALLRIAWWDWPAEQVIERVSLLCSPDVDELIRRFDPAGRPHP